MFPPAVVQGFPRLLLAQLPRKQLMRCSTRSVVVAATSANPRNLPRSVRVAHILLPADKTEQLEKLRKLLEGRRGGDLGWISRDAYPPSFQAAVADAKVGEVVTAATDRGNHLIKVLTERYQAELQHISVQELAELMSNPGLVEDVQLVDVREPWEWELSRLPGFKLMPLNSAADWAPKLTQELDPHKETLVLCHHGVRSMNMAMYLLQNGFSDVKNITGGIDAFSRGVDSRVPTY